MSEKGIPPGVVDAGANMRYEAQRRKHKEDAEQQKQFKNLEGIKYTEGDPNVVKANQMNTPPRLVGRK